MMKKICLLLILFTQISCSNDDTPQQFCTTVFVYGLSITVTDATSNTILTEDVSVIARDGSYEESLMNNEGFDEFFGAGERPGNYTIEIMAPNYQTFTSEVITVELTRDACHVETEVLEYQLQPI